MAKRGTAGLKYNELRKYALAGAEWRLLLIAQEAAAIYRAFPELRDRGGQSGMAARSGGDETSAPGKRRRRRMSAAGRKRISDAQKKRWAERRRAKR